MKTTHSTSMLLILGTLFLFGCGGSDPSDVVVDFQEHIDQGEIDEAYGLLAGEFVAMVPPEKLKAGMAKSTADASQKGGVKSFEVLSEEITGLTAKVTARTTFGDGSTDESTLDLTKINDEWKITPSMNK